MGRRPTTPIHFSRGCQWIGRTEAVTREFKECLVYVTLYPDVEKVKAFFREFGTPNLATEDQLFPAGRTRVDGRGGQEGVARIIYENPHDRRDRLCRDHIVHV